MRIKFNDLSRIHNLVEQNINKGFSKIVKESSFILGETLAGFEEKYSKYTNSKHTIGCGNGTEAIELTLRALGIGKNDEVLLPANTFIATAIAVTRTGATPIFYDCDRFFLSDVESIIRKISRKTKAIIAVHLYGQIANVEEISKIAKKNNLSFIEDSAQAHGSRRNGNQPGKYSNAATYSFYPGKNLGAWGDGGAITTNNTQLKNKLLYLRNWGSVKKYEHKIVGFNSRLDPMQAVVLNEKLKYLDDWNAMRNQISDIYLNNINEGKKIELPKVDKLNYHVWHLFVLKVKNRSKFIDHLSSNGIETVIHYPKIIPNQKAYSDNKQMVTDYENAYNNESKLVSIPLFPLMNKSEIKKVLTVVNSY
jgi:dTDP-4-amino-4,6-dideoxygalactose transaminase|tara:strand:+ start:4298 stop:5392 length:1095 start_codon:yes stop_codon:yes gene_type:complete